MSKYIGKAVAMDLEVTVSDSSVGRRSLKFTVSRNLSLFLRTLCENVPMLSALSEESHSFTTITSDFKITIEGDRQIFLKDIEFTSSERNISYKTTPIVLDVTIDSGGKISISDGLPSCEQVQVPYIMPFRGTVSYTTHSDSLDCVGRILFKDNVPRHIRFHRLLHQLIYDEKVKVPLMLFGWIVLDEAKKPHITYIPREIYFNGQKLLPKDIMVPDSRLFFWLCIQFGEPIAIKLTPFFKCISKYFSSEPPSLAYSRKYKVVGCFDNKIHLRLFCGITYVDYRYCHGVFDPPCHRLYPGGIKRMNNLVYYYSIF